jgi:acyl-CoA synthetase (NDP forming)
VWGTGADTRGLFAGSLSVLADDPSVAAVALAVDLVRELDADDSYQLAVLDAARRTSKPVAVLSNLASAIDQDLAAQLRQDGIPVLEGLRTGLLALGHLLDHTGARMRYAPPSSAQDGARSLAAHFVPPYLALDEARSPASRSVPPRPALDEARRQRGLSLLAAGTASGAALLDLLREYGIASARATPASSANGALAAAEAIGFPVVLKTDEPAIQHKSDARGVVLGVRGPAELAAAYHDLSARLGSRVLVCETIPGGVELALGIARDPALGPLVVVGAGGVLVEVLADRAVALPPVDEGLARQLLGELRIAALLDGFRGAPPADLDAIIRAITGLSALAAELGEQLAALDVNPLICGPGGAVAVDALAIARLS